MEKPFPAYKGNETYIFVSYSHEDNDLVYPELQFLDDLGINVWYDEGISPGSRWSDALADALVGSAHFLFFVTPRSVASQNCLDEVGFALEQGKPLLAVHLERTQLPAGLALRLGSRQAIVKFELADRAYRDKLAEALSAHVVERDNAAASEPALALEASDRVYATMAVLPFENRSSEPDLTAFGETLGEEIGHIIGTVWNGLRLIGVSETRHYAERNASSREIAEELEVGMVVRGSIRKLGDRVRINAELVGDQGEQLWTHRFDVNMTTLIDEEDRIVDMIITGVDRSRSIFMQTRARECAEAQLGPWGLWVRAWATFDVADEQKREEAFRLTRRAIELDPHQPLFKAELAFYLAINVLQGFSDEREAHTREALRNAEIAAKTDIAICLVDAGQVFGFLGDHERALSLCKRAYDMASRWVPLINTYAIRLLYSGDAREALSLFLHADGLRLPGQLSQAQMICQCHAVLGDLDSALHWGNQAADQNNAPQIAHSAHANVLARLNRIDEAMMAIQRIRQTIPQYRLRGSINAYRRAYGTEDARVAVTEGLQKLVDLGYE